ncbi:MAG: hypothetical protein PVJ02_14640 [Gemmatimonadota bacterium]
MDWVILTLAAPFRLFLSYRSSVITAGYLLGPVVGVASLIVLTAAARVVLRDRAARWVPFVAAAQYWVLYSFAPVRPDHHGVQVLLFLVALLGVLRICVGRSVSPAAWVTGLGLGLAVWVSVEGLISTAPLLVALVVLWIVRGGPELTGAIARLWLVGTATLAAGMLVDGPHPHRWAVEFDRFSVVYLTAFALSAAFWVVLVWKTPDSRVRRAGAAVACALAGGVALILLFPGVQRGPMANMDPRLVPLWVRYISEFVPAMRLGTSTWGVLSVGSGLLGLVVAGYLVVASGRRGWDGILRLGGADRAVWALLTGALLWFLVLGEIEQVRWVYYLQILAPVGVAALLSRALGYAREMQAAPIVRAAAGVAVVIVLFLWPLAFLAVPAPPDPVEQTKIACRPGPLVGPLSGLRGPGGRPARVLAPVFWGPELLFRSGVDIVAGPYHRNASGMLYSYGVMAATDPKDAMASLRERGIDFIVICREQDWIPRVPADSTGTFYHALVEGTLPAGLLTVPMPGVPPRYRLYRVSAPPA